LKRASFAEIGERLLIRDEVRLAIIEKINRGELRPGDRLSSETEIARQLGVSRNSVREALQSLERDGLVEKRHGVGTFVTASLPLLRGGIERLTSINDFIASHGLQPESHVTEMTFVKADKEQAENLQVEVGTDLLFVKMRKSAHGRPIALCVDLVPAEYLSRQVEKETFGESIFTFLEEHGLNIRYADCEIAACLAEREIGETLGVDVGDPLLLFCQVHFDDENRPVLYSETYFPPGNIRFNVIRKR
jgi:GntR family transcriptional regulator